ncbi:MAG: HU family DNA-binding protein [Candidatus Scalindua sp. AMX11]|nr:MAG: HU family DNA-binding protein [Candidatus Scalindua sp.]NOG84366.1 HU family DNA-binding protein [Planctomycetota bacterium]RZV74447.1 MAG: HU family DNA-binding protein [Candidatus Scalindua sp. SCAELEC01]TDE65369.1 MAG: HU family DNA-binding protein [Candidatus Scalindua sp. AMX11]GJQ60318.1 MAG: transcriptional regulator [Candidatus Scalindua sp.]
MNKRDLIESVSKELDISKADGERAVNSVLANISKGVKKDKSVQLLGFGSFLVKKRKARKARNPQTGEMIKVKASKTVGFKVGKKFKEMI